MEKRLEQIYKIVKNGFEESDYKYHILLVVKYAKELAKIYGANEEITEIAALLHDIGRMDIKNDDVHHIIGIQEAENILKNLEYSEEVIREVKHCVASHRTNEGPDPETIIAKIVANADAMSHFDILPVFYFWRGKRSYKVEEITKWTENKLNNDWDKKITLPEAKKLVENKYEAIKVLISAIKEYDGNDNQKNE